MSSNTLIKKLTQVTAFSAFLIGSVGFIGSANAAPGGVPGPPDDGGGGAPPQDFGDLIILYRDASGVPYLTAGDPAPNGTGLCQQPLPSDACLLTPPDGCTLVAGDPADVAGTLVVPVNTDTCAVTAACATCTEEVDFGRTSVARSSVEVFESQLADVVVNLATSDCVVSLDPAGRMVTGTILDDTVDPVLYSTSAIDSPLQNLAIYRELILTGTIGVSLAQGATVLDTAARGLGVASDKTGEVNVDQVAYLNQIMGLSDPATLTILDPKLCIDVREEVLGTVQLVEKCFLDYTVPPPDTLVAYDYVRNTNFLGLPAPAYIPDTGPVPGWFEYLAVLDLGLPSFQILQGPITTAVFADEPFSDDNIGGFTQASDDTRAVINFMHDWPIPDADVYATAVPCEELAGITYDVSISDVSGLSVPKNYVNGGEREFTVTVANAGPDPASGTVTVTASTGTEDDVVWGPYEFTDLAAGASESFVQLFTITTSSDTIDWTAVAFAEFDVIEDNNTVTATSTVKASGGGGGNPN